MNDENERSVASAGSMADIIDRLLAALEPTQRATRTYVVSAAAEIERLRLAISRIAEQDATLSVCDGNVTVTLDATLTDEEREAISRSAATARSNAAACLMSNMSELANTYSRDADALLALLERTK